MRQIVRKMIAMMLLCTAVFVMSNISVLAYDMPDETHDCSLTMTLKDPDSDARAAGSKVTIRLVADVAFVHGVPEYTLTSEYAGSGIDITGDLGTDTANELAHYSSVSGIGGTTVVADGSGTVLFDGLKCGVYLITAEELAPGFKSFVPFIYFLPYFDKTVNNWSYDGTAVPKISYQAPVSVSVRKIWNDDGKDRPSEITVQLKNENGVFDTVKLSDANNWRYQWDGLDSSLNWNVVEINIPLKYKATYSVTGNDFTITNTDQLVQTGQLDWPIPVLIFAGVLLLGAGVVLKISSRREDEG